MNLSYKKIAILFGVALMVIFVSLVLFLVSVGDLEERFESVDHTNQVAIACEQSYSSLISAETDVRGFLITRDKEFLRNFSQHEENVFSGIGKLKELTKDNLSQQQRIANFEKIVLARFDLFDSVLEAKQENVMVIAKGSRVLSEKARSVFTEMAQEERRLMAQRKNAFIDSQSALFRTIPVVMFIVLLLMGVLLVLMYLEVRHRKKIEHELAESESTIQRIKELEFLADSIPQIIWTAKSDGNIDYYNRYFHEYTGTTFEQTKNWDWKVVVHPEDVDNCIRLWKRSLETGSDYEIETRFKKASTKEYRWHLERASPLRNSKGEITKWFGSATDIHEKKQEEDQLKLSHFNLKRLHETIFQSSPYSIISTNINGIITSYNKASEEQLGYTAEEVIGIHTPGLFHDFDEVIQRSKEISEELGIKLEPGMSIIEAKAKLGIRNMDEWTHVRKDGSRYPVRLSITALKNDSEEILGYMGIAIDISEERKIKELATEKEDQLRAFVEHLPTSAAMYDENLRFLSVSGQFLKEGQKTLSEMLGRRHEEVFPSNVLGPKLSKALEGAVIKEIDVRLLQGPKLTEEYYDMEMRPWYKHDGTIGGVILMAQNITSRMKTLNELTRKNQMLNAMLENMPVRMYRFDKDGNYLDVMGKGWKDIGMDPSSLLGKNVYELFPHKKEEIEKAFLAKDNYGISVNYDVMGQERYFQNHVFSDETNEGGVIGLALDITESKNREKEIQESEARFRGLLDSAPDAMIIANEEGRIELINSQAKKMFGYEENELIGQQIELLIPSITETATTKWTDFFAASYSKDLGTSIELYAKKKDGTSFPAEISLSPFQNKNERVVSAAIRDATERKQIQLQLEEAKTMAENANRFKSNFLANMSHEIRTPLNAIIGFADVLAKQSISEQQREEYLGYINSSGNLLLKLIGDVLDISKIEVGKLELVKDSFFFKEVISSAIMPYKYTANEKGLDFYLNFDGDIPDYVIGDSNRIKQVIINLIGNALKFTKQGKVSIDISNISGEWSNEKVKLRIAVSDTGPGIPLEQHGSVFESFTQADDSIGRQFGGTGLGLAIVHEMVRLMGGEIQIVSPYTTDPTLGGPGSCFLFVIELQIDHSKTQPETKPLVDKPLRLSNAKILVAEDNMVNQRLAKLVLTNLGCNVVFANNGKEAVEKLLQEEFELVLMDVQMPVMDGYTATRMIRKDLNLQLPVIGLTANVFKEDIENCLDAGMNDYLGKPYNESQMGQILHKWLI